MTGRARSAPRRPSRRRSRVVLPKERRDRPRAVRGALQRTMSSDCGVVRDADGLQLAARHARRPRAPGRRSPGPQIAGYEVIDLLRVSQSIVASATARTESRGVAHAPRLPRTVRRRARPVRLSRRRDARLRRAAAASSREVGDDRASTRPGRWSGGWSTDALAEDLGVLGDITSLACIDEDAARRGGVRRPRRRRARRHRARDRDVPPGRRRRRRAMARPRRRPGRGRRASSAASRVRCARSSPASGPRSNFLCHCSGVATMTHRYVRGRARQGPRPRHAQDAARPARDRSAPRCAPAAASTIATRCPTRC